MASSCETAVEVRAISKRFDRTVALDDVSMTVRRGEFVSLLGSSGCGKTTLLRIIGGFETPTSGDIILSGRSVLRGPPYRRPTNMIFQHLALFPHLTVLRNISFGLEVKKLESKEISARAESALALVELSGYEDRTIDQLSGGQRQRVAIARALVNQPEVLLLDEPLAALDLRLRLQMQSELKRIHRKTGNTFIFVTHDQGEAIVLSDRIAVMSGGRIVQLGTPRDIYERPQTAFVAKFIGNANFIEGRVESCSSDGTCRLVSPGGRHFVGKAQGRVEVGADFLIFLRYEKVQLGAQTGNLVGAVVEKTYLGPTVRVTVRIDDELLIVSESPNTDFTNALNIGDQVHPHWGTDDAIVLPFRN